MKCPFTFKWEMITPEIAAEWLAKHNTHNRPLRGPTVDSYARDMKTNRWSPNHQGIAFAASGALLDGQHRLAAIVSSGVTVWMLVFRDVPERVEGVTAKVMETVDRGNTRSLADLLRLDYGITDSPGTIAATLLHLGRLCVDHPEQQASRASMPQIVLVLEQFKESIQWMSNAKARGVGVRSAVIWATLAFAHAVKPREVEAFAERFKSGAGLKADSPALTLRNAAFAGDFEAGTTGARWQNGARILALVAADLEGRPMPKMATLDQGIAALRWWRDWQRSRVDTVAAAFPLLREIDAKRTKLATRAIMKPLKAPSPETPAPFVPVTTAKNFNMTPAARRLLERVKA